MLGRYRQAVKPNSPSAVFCKYKNLMWIVRLALKRPYTFVVMALVIVILGVLAIFRMPSDIFPEINIPVVERDLELFRNVA